MEYIFSQVYLLTLSCRPPENSYQCLNVVSAYQHSVPICSKTSDTTNIIQSMTFLPVQKTRYRPLQGEKERLSLSDLQQSALSHSIFKERKMWCYFNTYETAITLKRKKISLNITCFTPPDLITPRHHDSGRQLWSLLTKNKII